MSKQEYTFTVGDNVADWQALDAFTQGYIMALFHRACSCPSWYSLPGHVGFSDLSPASIKRIVRDCKAFQKRNAEALARVLYSKRFLEPNSPMQYTEACAGRDFFGSRNGLTYIGFLEAGLPFDPTRADDFSPPEVLDLAAIDAGQVTFSFTRGKVVVS